MQDRQCAWRTTTVFLRFRDGLLAAGTLEAYYLRLMRSGTVDVPAVFIDAVVQALLRNVLDTSNDHAGSPRGRDAVSPAAHHLARRPDAGG